MTFQKNTPNQGSSKQNNSFQNKDIAGAIGNLPALPRDFIKLHPTPEHLKNSVSGLGAFVPTEKIYHLANSVSPPEERMNDQPNVDVQNKVNTINGLQQSEQPIDYEYLTKPTKIRAIAKRLGLPKVAPCGAFPINRDINITLTKNANGGKSTNGLRSCNCKHCASCQTKIAIKRESEINTMIQNAVEEGYSLIFATFTASHSLRDHIKKTRHNIKSILSSTTNKLRIKRLFRLKPLPKKLIGANQEEIYKASLSKVSIPQTTIEYAGNIIRYEDRFDEKTGWHSHAHVIYFVKPDGDKLSDKQLERISETIFAEYHLQAVKMGIKVHKRGFDCKAIEGYKEGLSGYMVKVEVDEKPAKEFTDIFNKQGESKSLFQLMLQWDELKDTDTKKADYIKAKIFELSGAIANSRDLYINPSIDNQFGGSDGANERMTDKEILEQKQDSIEIIAQIPYDIWTILRKRKLHDYAKTIGLRHGIDPMIGFLCERGLYACYDDDTKRIELLE